MEWKGEQTQQDLQNTPNSVFKKKKKRTNYLLGVLEEQCSLNHLMFFKSFCSFNTFLAECIVNAKLSCNWHAVSRNAYVPLHCLQSVLCLLLLWCHSEWLRCEVNKRFNVEILFRFAAAIWGWPSLELGRVSFKRD